MSLRTWRRYIDIAEVAPIGGGLAKLNPLAYWTLEDCFDYAAAQGVPWGARGPLHVDTFTRLCVSSSETLSRRRVPASRESFPARRRLHPTVGLGYPSQGDAKDTVPVPDPDGLRAFRRDIAFEKKRRGETFSYTGARSRRKRRGRDLERYPR